MLLVGDYEGDSPLSNMLPNQSQFLLSELPNRIRVTARTLELILVYPPIHRILVHSADDPGLSSHPEHPGSNPHETEYIFRQKMSHISYLISHIY